MKLNRVLNPEQWTTCTIYDGNAWDAIYNVLDGKRPPLIRSRDLVKINMRPVALIVYNELQGTKGWRND